MHNIARDLFTRFNKSAAVAVLGASALVATVMPQTAAAGYDNVAGSICQPYYGSQANDFNYYTTGIRNQSSSDRWVLCPLARPQTSSSVHAWVNMYNTIGGNAICALYSYNGVGSYLGGTNDSTIASGSATAYMTLSGAAATSGYQSVMCKLGPGSYVRSIKLWY